MIYKPLCEAMSLDISMSDPTNRSNISTKSSFPFGFEYRLMAGSRPFMKKVLGEFQLPLSAAVIRESRPLWRCWLGSRQCYIVAQA